MNIGQTVYETICKAAERGDKCMKVELPEELYLEFMTEPGMQRMMGAFGVDVVSGTGIVPKFFYRMKHENI